MREYRTPATVANDIRLKRDAHEGAFVVVEGIDDKRLYSRFVSQPDCQIEVAGGKENVLGALAILNQAQFPGVLGIVDLDFDWLTRDAPLVDNVATLEVHDADMLLLRSTALGRVLDEFGSSQKIDAFQHSRGHPVQEILLGAATPLAYLRLHSVRAALSLKFQGLRFGDFIDRHTLDVGIPEMIQAVKNRTPGVGPDARVLEEALGELEDGSHDKWKLCNGHDTLNILSIGLRHAIGSRGAHDVGEDELRKLLRLALHPDDFGQTLLAESIVRWQTGNGYKILDSNLVTVG